MFRCIWGHIRQEITVSFCSLVQLCRLKLFCSPYLPFLQGKAHRAAESLLKLLLLPQWCPWEGIPPFPLWIPVIPSAHLWALTGQVHWQENLPGGKFSCRETNKQTVGEIGSWWAWICFGMKRSWHCWNLLNTKETEKGNPVCASQEGYKALPPQFISGAGNTGRGTLLKESYQKKFLG